MENPITKESLEEHLSKTSTRLFLTPEVEENLREKIKSDPLLNGATELRFFDANQKQEHRDAAVKYMRSAAMHWQELAEIASSQYHPQYLARNSHLDWKGLIPRVLEDVAIAEGRLESHSFGPSPRTNNLSP